MKSILTLLLALSSIYLSAQVYANDALKNQAEQDSQKKVKVLSANESVTGIVQKKETSTINKSLLENAFTLISIEALDYSKKHTSDEMKTFNEESIVEFEKTEIRISKNFDLIYFGSKTDESEYSTKKIYLDGNTIKYLDCDKCDSFSFIIVEQTSDYLVLETKAQDEGKFYTTRLILKK